MARCCGGERAAGLLAEKTAAWPPPTPGLRQTEALFTAQPAGLIPRWPTGQEAGAMLKSILTEKGRGGGGDGSGGVLMGTARLQMRENVVANYRTGSLERAGHVLTLLSNMHLSGGECCYYNAPEDRPVTSTWCVGFFGVLGFFFTSLLTQLSQIKCGWNLILSRLKHRAGAVATDATEDLTMSPSKCQIKRSLCFWVVVFCFFLNHVTWELPRLSGVQMNRRNITSKKAWRAAPPRRKVQKKKSRVFPPTFYFSNTDAIKMNFVFFFFLVDVCRL